ncbi:hypothetical protein PR048_006449 [Dryococelus australis]|uniref:Uncharacterized protein n=1 Tax=Dryococelus australis TaxID=614101 RepID=A0ABQ9IB46_9NEOP|nr:hypothetical protein PR048_006449 [Dryococelus australis]
MFDNPKRKLSDHDTQFTAALWKKKPQRALYVRDWEVVVDILPYAAHKWMDMLLHINHFLNLHVHFSIGYCPSEVVTGEAPTDNLSCEVEFPAGQAIVEPDMISEM